MKYQALTLKAPCIARSIVLPVVVSQAKTLCKKFNLDIGDGLLFKHTPIQMEEKGDVLVGTYELK